TGLTAADVLAVARRGACGELDPAARERVAEVRAHVDELASGATPVYGVSTGFGALADTAIPTHMRQALQRSLIRSHAAGPRPAPPRPAGPRPASRRWPTPRTPPTCARRRSAP